MAQQPSIKSRASIFTLRGLSLRLLNVSAVTIGYFSNSFALSCGNKFVLCCHRLSTADSLLGAELITRRRDCLGAHTGGGRDKLCTYLVLEQTSWENSRRNSREVNRLSMTTDRSSLWGSELQYWLHGPSFLMV